MQELSAKNKTGRLREFMDNPDWPEHSSDEEGRSGPGHEDNDDEMQ